MLVDAPQTSRGEVGEIGLPQGLKAACARVLKATLQRRAHILRGALAYAGKGQRQLVLALINTVFAREDQMARLS